MNNSSPYRLGNIKYINRNFAVAVGDSNQVYIYRRPPAPTCDLKILSGDTINSNELLKWSPASGCIGGYYLSIGTAPNKKDILDSLDVEDVLQYNLSKLQTKQNIYITLTPYNDGGVAPTCNSKKIYYNQCTLTTRIDTIIKLGITIEGVVYTKDTVITKAYKSQQGCDSIVNIYVDVLTSNQDLSAEFIQSLTVAPNPTAGNLQVTFQLKSATSGKLYITDRLGRTLWQSETKEWSTGQQTLDLDVSQYPSGVYQLHWQSNRGRSVVSWMKGG
ncbi:MAG: T9SS type A sorting domain-containing protein [Saprospiraceae bacterium]|nr:T9SS type A sorting domain-containing protein [Saprospiraceae bacterium]